MTIYDYVNVDSPNLGFPYFNFLREYQWKNSLYAFLKFGLPMTKNSSSVSSLQRCTLTEGDSVCLQGGEFYANLEFPNSKKGHTGRPVVPAPGASSESGEKGRGYGMDGGEF